MSEQMSVEELKAWKANVEEWGGPTGLIEKRLWDARRQAHKVKVEEAKVQGKWLPPFEEPTWKGGTPW